MSYKTKEEKLKAVLKEWKQKGDDLFKEAQIARKHNYHLEAMMLDEKYRLIRDFCMDIEMKVVEDLITI